MSEPRVPDVVDDDGRRSSEPAAASGWDGLLVFGSDGRLIASTVGSLEPIGPPVQTVAELETRYRQSDGMPIDLRRRGRHVGIPVDGRGPRVMLASEPLAARDGSPLALAVTVDAFRNESDPETVQRALSSVLAHELRTPMTTVYGGADLLAKPELPESTRLEAATSVATAAEQLHRVVEDLVVLVRWAGDRADDAEPVLLQPLLRAAVRRAARPPAEIQLLVGHDVAPVAANPGLVEHLVRNLISHALRNTPPAGTVVVAARDEAEWVELTVTDEGPTLTDEERPHAFDLFAPTSRQAADPSGANLPLVAARRLVERLGGRIEAGRPERGGQTIVRLPAIREAGPGDPL